MKLPVYDSVNKARLLGHLSHHGSLISSRVEVSVSYGSQACYSSHQGPQDSPFKRVVFDVERRSESKAVQDNPAQRTITTVETTVLETKLPLDELCEIGTFTPLGGRTASYNELKQRYRGVEMTYETYRVVRELERTRALY